MDERSVLLKLLAATTWREVNEAYEALVTRGAIERPVGDRDSNVPTINITGDPDATCIERLTNAIDATLEAKAEAVPELKAANSPRAFVAAAFRLPSGAMSTLLKKQKEDLVDQAGITMRILPGDAPDSPTIEIRDHGIGLRPAEIPNTILSLNQSNKISRWYLMGRFGQGGSTTFRFSDFTIIITRRRIPGGHDDTPIAFTIVRYVNPQRGEKDGRYVYLVGPDQMPFSAPSSVADFETGTLVRHVNYRFSKKMIFADIYAICERYLFDPVLPFWLIENRAREDRRRIFGSRDRLQRSEYVVAKDEFAVPFHRDPHLGRLIIRYWALKGGTETKVKQTFVDPTDPIVITYLGQTHAQLPRRILNQDCKLPYLYKDLIVQVDCDEISDEGRQRIFTSTRETITKEGRRMIEEALVAALRGDDDLRALEEEREREFFMGPVKKEQEAMRRQLAEMINRIKPGMFSAAIGQGESKRRKKRSGGPSRQREPLPTSSFPTYLRIANAPPVRLVPGGQTRIELNSDAPDGFLAAQGLSGGLALAEGTAKKVRLSSQHRDFLGGRLYLRVEPTEDVLPGDELTLEVLLTGRRASSDPSQTFQASVAAVVDKPEAGGKGNSQTLWAPEIVEVGPEVGGAGQAFWEQEGWNEENVAEVKMSEDSIRIFVSTANRWLLGALKGSGVGVGAKSMLRNRYMLHVAFHAYLQEDRMRQIPEGLPEEIYERIKSDELDRASRTLCTALTSAGAFAMEEAT